MDFRSYLRYVNRTFGDPAKVREIASHGPMQAGVRRLPCRVRSRLLREEIWLTRDRSQLGQVPEGGVSYLPSEIRVLKKLSPENVRRIHVIKKELDGFIRWLGDKEPSKN